MPKRAAILHTDDETGITVVDNVILIPDDGYEPPEGTVLAVLGDGVPCAPGWIVEGDAYVEPEPDLTLLGVDGFLDAMDDQLPREVTRALLSNYPDITSALNRGKYQRAWDGFADAVADGAVTEEQHALIVELAEVYGVPSVFDEEQDGEQDV